MRKIIGIYKITNLVNGKIYIGQSINIYDRWNQHLTKAFNTKDSLTLDIIKEYNDGDGNLYLKLYYMLAHMGNFLNEKYASLGLRCFDKMNTTLNNSKAIILKYAKECYDRRPEPASGFPDVKFKKK